MENSDGGFVKHYVSIYERATMGLTSQDTRFDDQGDEINNFGMGRPEASAVAHQVIGHTQCDKYITQGTESIPNLQIQLNQRSESDK